MKLVDMTCTGCGANVKVDAAVKVATCTVCGKQMLIEHTGEFGAGYEREMGRIQAQRDVEESWKKEREEKIRIAEEEKKRKAEQQEMDRIRQQLNKICIIEAIICFIFLISPIAVRDGVAVGSIRFGAGFIQLGLIAFVTFFFTKDKWYGKVILACLVCAILSIITTFLASSVVWFLIFNILKLIWMIRVERVRYSWKEIAGQVVGKN
ncbi:MAG: hypothetical protein IKZ90_07710 [Clostridiales bacterium]|jgi:predicted RNA-binding Zn-ribbon protein involved in translation (DUF1610 family)|nr:hypothetical protein [Clostridiales bacterium]